ncbi:MAG TPA: IS1380 family transposase [Nocardioidaceae bacterium]|nr:IS1380 family transposase [Nocardioidaceae bacterium]
MHATSRRGTFAVTADGHGMTGRAGTALLAEAADRLGLTGALSRLAGGCRSWVLHDPGKVLRDLIVTLADGGDALRHTGVLAGQPVLFGTVASPATTNRTLVAVADDASAVALLDAARKAARGVAWRNGAAPPVIAAALAGTRPDEPLCIDVDATLITAHSDDKDGAGKTYKRTWGFHPLGAWLDRGDGLGEALAATLRPGNAGANTATDHIAVYDAAMDQLGVLPRAVDVLVRADSAGATHDFVDHLRVTGAGFSVGFAITAAVRDAIRVLPDRAWTPAVRQDGQPRAGAAAAELSDAVDLSGWPTGSRLIVRREPLHPGAQQTIDDIDGARFTCFLTDQTEADLAQLDARHRAHARVEDRIRGAKDTGARNLPCDTFARNAVWLQLVLAAQDLMTFMQTLTLDGTLRVAEPATLRYQLLHVPARITRSGRRTVLRIERTWPWADALVTAFTRLRALPLPAT